MMGLGLVTSLVGCASGKHARRDDGPRRPMLTNITDALDGFAETDASNPDRAVAAWEQASRTMLVHIENNDFCVHADGADSVSDGTTPRKTALHALGGEVHVSTGPGDGENRLGVVALKPEAVIATGTPVIFWGVRDGKRASVTTADGSRFVCDIGALGRGATLDGKAPQAFVSIAGKSEIALRAQQGFVAATVTKNLGAAVDDFQQCAAKVWSKPASDDAAKARLRQKVYSTCGSSIDRFGALVAEANKTWSVRRTEIAKRGLSRWADLASAM